MSKPLTDLECEVRISKLSMIIQLEEQVRASHLEEEGMEEVQQLAFYVKMKMREFDKSLDKRKKNLAIEKNLYISRVQNANRIKRLMERDKLILDIVLAAHNRLGKVDHKGHRKAYRRILYALVLQGLCRLTEPIVKVKFRKSDLRIGLSVLHQASLQFEKMAGKPVTIYADSKQFLPLESCGGVDLYNNDETIYIRNSLAVRLDKVLFMANPLIRFLLFGRNPHRKYYDLSSMCKIGNQTFAMSAVEENYNKLPLYTHVLHNEKQNTDEFEKINEVF